MAIEAPSGPIATLATDRPSGDHAGYTVGTAVPACRTVIPPVLSAIDRVPSRPASAILAGAVPAVSGDGAPRCDRPTRAPARTIETNSTGPASVEGSRTGEDRSRGDSPV